jgi:hypothetical protein
MDSNGTTVDAGIDAMVDPCAGPEIAIEDLGMCYGLVMCEYMLNCSNRIESHEMCMELLLPARIEVQFRRYEDAIAAGRLSYDAEAAALCLATVNPETCTDIEDQEVCDEVFIGTVSPGGLCYDSMECAVRNSTCDDLDCEEQCCPGTCTSPAELGAECIDVGCEPGNHCVNPDYANDYRCYAGEAGDPCNGDWDCDEEFHCYEATSSCVADVGDGVCTRDEQCTRPLYCLGDAMPDGTGSCAEAVAVGQDCDEECDGYLQCTYMPGSESPGSCQPHPGVGESCAAPDADCPYNTYCDSVSLECTPRLGLDVDCSVNPCRLELVCGPSDICRERPGVGAPCTDGACAFGLFCSSEITGNLTGVCWEPQPAGAACEYSEHCQSRICAAVEGGTYECQNYEVCGG